MGGGGGCCHTEAKAITHLLLKIMKKLNELIISGEKEIGRQRWRKGQKDKVKERSREKETVC